MPPAMVNKMYSSILHASLIVGDLQLSLKFYVEILGFKLDTTRPDLGYEGAWLSVAKGQQIHLLALPNPDPVLGRPAHGGRDRHVAIGVLDFNQLIEKLEENSIVYTKSKSGRSALFCRDPDGNALEFVAA